VAPQAPSDEDEAAAAAAAAEVEVQSTVGATTFLLRMAAVVRNEVLLAHGDAALDETKRRETEQEPVVAEPKTDALLRMPRIVVVAVAFAPTPLLVVFVLLLKRSVGTRQRVVRPRRLLANIFSGGEREIVYSGISGRKLTFEAVCGYGSDFRAMERKTRFFSVLGEEAGVCSP
jgi:uncharacterized membrane protein YgcG